MSTLVRLVGARVGLLLCLALGCGRTMPFDPTRTDAGPNVPPGCTEPFEAPRTIVTLLGGAGASVAGADEGPWLGWVHHQDSAGTLEWLVVQTHPDGAQLSSVERVFITHLPPPPYRYQSAPRMAWNAGYLAVVGNDSVNGNRLSVRSAQGWRQVPLPPRLVQGEVRGLHLRDGVISLVASDDDGIGLTRLRASDGELVHASALPARPTGLTRGFTSRFDEDGGLIIAWAYEPSAGALPRILVQRRYLDGPWQDGAHFEAEAFSEFAALQRPDDRWSLVWRDGGHAGTLLSENGMQVPGSQWRRPEQPGLVTIGRWDDALFLLSTSRVTSTSFDRIRLHLLSAAGIPQGEGVEVESGGRVGGLWPLDGDDGAYLVEALTLGPAQDGVARIRKLRCLP